MEAAVEYPDLHIIHRVVGQYAIYHRLLKSFLNSRNIFAGNGSAEEIIHKLVMLSGIFCSPFCINRTQFKNDIGKLTTATRLFFQYLAMFNSCLECFLISYLWRSLVDL